MGTYANFYNSDNGDRVYDADNFSEWLRPFFKTGVFNGELQVLASSGMEVIVDTGNAFIEGKLKKFDSQTTLTVEQASANSTRIDAVVCRRNDTDRDFTLMVVKGSTVAPLPVRENGIYDIVLAHITVPASAVEIKQENITDTRMNADICGWVVSNIEEVDFDQVTTQWADYIANFKVNELQAFNEWFDTIKGQLSTDQAGSLQLQIDEQANKIATNTANISANKADIDANSADITSLQQTTSKNTSDIATNKANIATNTTSITNLNNATRINLLRPTLQTQTVNGVTCTNNGGTYTLNGTATAQTAFKIMSITVNDFIGKKLLGCPSGGSPSTYCLVVSYYNEANKWQKETYDFGSGKIIENSAKIEIMILIRSGTVCNNLLFKPMITPNLNATYDDFVSYEDSLATNRVMSTRMNLLKPTLETTTKNGVTCINNNDGTYTLNGVSQNAFDFPLCNFELPKGTYKFVGSLRNNGDYFMYVINHTLNENYIGDVGNGYIFTINQTCNLTFLLWGKQNITFNNLLFKPMLTTNLNATYDDFIACLGTTWTQDTTNGYYTQTIICNGITSNDNPPIDVVISGTLAEMQAQQEEWGKILKIETSTNTLTFYASEATTVSLSVLVKGV